MAATIFEFVSSADLLLIRVKTPFALVEHLLNGHAVGGISSARCRSRRAPLDAGFLQAGRIPCLQLGSGSLGGCHGTCLLSSSSRALRAGAGTSVVRIQVGRANASVPPQRFGVHVKAAEVGQILPTASLRHVARVDTEVARLLTTDYTTTMHFLTNNQDRNGQILNFESRSILQSR